MIQRLLLSMFVVSVVGLAATTPAAAQGTFTDTVVPNATKYYRFTPATSGQVTATLSWDSETSDLMMILVCGTDSPLTFGVAAGGLDRTARLESGVFGTNPCLLGISTFNTSAVYRLNLQRSTDQLASVHIPTFSGVSRATDGLLDRRLVEYAEQALIDLRIRKR